MNVNHCSHLSSLLSVTLLLTGPTLVVACGDDDGSNSDSGLVPGDTDAGPGPEEDPVVAAIAAIASLEARTAAACSDNSEAYTSDFATRTELEATWKEWGADLYAALVGEVEAGRLLFDQSQLDGCLAAIEAIGCGWPLETLEANIPECRRLFAAPSPPPVGTACISNLQCNLDEGQECQCGGTSGAGTCQTAEYSAAIFEEGQACVFDSNEATCGDYSFLACQPAENNGTACVPIAELAVGDEGEECASMILDVAAGTADDVEAITFCRDGLTCVPDAGSWTNDDDFEEATFRCQPPASENASCGAALQNPCADGLYCDFGDVNFDEVSEISLLTGTCRPRLGEGQDCGDKENPITGSNVACAAGLTCDSAWGWDDPDARGVCVRLGRVGDSCSSDATCYSFNCSEGSCQEPLFCDNDSDT